MSALTDLRKVLCRKTKPFTSDSLAGFNIPSLSARLTDLINTGELEVVGEIAMKGAKPMKLYQKTAKRAEVQPVETRTVVAGTKLREVHWCEMQDKWTHKEWPNYDPVPPCPTLLELLTLLKMPKRKAQSVYPR